MKLKIDKGYINNKFSEEADYKIMTGQYIIKTVTIFTNYITIYKR